MEPVVLDLGTGVDVDVSLALLETLFSSGPVGYALLDHSLRFVRVSECLAQINGLPAGAHLGRIVEEVIGPDRWPSRKPIVERALAGERIMDIALSSLPTLQGASPHHVLTFYYPVRSSQRIVGLVVAVRDVTDQVAAQARLRQQSAAFENMWDALIITDLEGGITECNEAFVRHSGYSREKAYGQPISFLYMPEEREWVMPRIAEGLLRDGRWEGEVRFRRKDGSQGISLSSVVPLRDETGNVIGTVGVSRDITERKTADQDLRARAERETLLGPIGQAALLSPDPAALQATELSLLGERLKADRCFYVLYDENRNIAKIEKDWCREGIPSLEGEWNQAERGMLIRDIYAGGRSEVVEDVTARPVSPRLIKLFLETGQRSYVAAPYFDQGRPAAALTVMMASTARTWSAEEVALVEAAAVQVRGAVEAVRAAQREREAQARQRAFLRDVLASVTEGHLILCDTSDDLPSPLTPVGDPVALSRESGLRARCPSARTAQYRCAWKTGGRASPWNLCRRQRWLAGSARRQAWGTGSR